MKSRSILPAFVVGAMACAETMPSTATPPLRDLRVGLAIGETPGIDETVFGRIAGLAEDTNGRIFVADATVPAIRVFALDGNFLFSIGRQGSGPGEFQAVCCLGIDAGGRLWARDGGNARYSVFEVGETAAVAVESIRMAHNDANFQAPILFATGRFIDIGHRPSEAGLDLMHFHRSADGTIADSIRVPATPADSMGMRAVSVGNGATYFLYPPHGPLELVGHGPGGQYARALSSVYRIDWHDASGNLMRTIGLPDVIGPELTAEERGRAEQHVADEAERFGLSASERSAVPARRQPLSRLFFDSTGRLWVQRSTSTGQPRRADVWQPAGTHAFSVQWPADVDLLAVYDTFALGVRRDSLDVGSVVRLVMES